MISIKKLAVLSISSMLALGFIVGGATYAIFTDSASNTNNAFTAGTINISEKRDRGDSVPGPMFYTDISDTNTTDPGKYAYNVPKSDLLYPYGGEAIGGWAPGDTVQRTLIVESAGSLEARMSGLSASISGSYEIRDSLGNLVRTITGVTASSTGADLAAYNMFIDKFNVKIDAPGPIELYNGKLSTLLNGHTLPSTLLYPLGRNGSETALEFIVTLDKAADNTVQGKNIIINFTVNAEQKANQ
jgi:predicted ribosomally synthesized peptide with SipW-like signal peptide